MQKNAQLKLPSDWINPSQQAVLQGYAGGEFAYLAQCPTEDAYRAELDVCGDALLKFLLLEISAREECESREEAVARIEIATRDLMSVTGYLRRAPDWREPR